MRNEKKSYDRFVGLYNLVPKILQAIYNENTKANPSNDAFYELFDSLCWINKIIKIIRFWNISNSNNSGDLDNIEILTESLQEYSMVSDAKIYLFIRYYI